MVEEQSGDRPFDAIAETVNDQTAQALKLLGNETRLEIIVALWEVFERTPDPLEENESGLSFSALYDRVGVQDSGQFTYHLDKLTGTFVAQDDGTYELTGSAQEILSAVIRGAVSEPPSFTDEPVDTDCPVCGESVVIDYTDGILRMLCTDCEGYLRDPDFPTGLLLAASRSPAGLRNRTPQEFFRQGNVSLRHREFSWHEGVCPNCTGTVTATPYICEEHDLEDDTICHRCDRQYKIGWDFVCDVCKMGFGTYGWAPIFAETAVVSFCHDRGLDIKSIYNTMSRNRVVDAVETTVSARDPLELTVVVELEGDRLTVTLDNDANVVDIEKAIGVA